MYINNKKIKRKFSLIFSLIFLLVILTGCTQKIELLEESLADYSDSAGLSLKTKEALLGENLCVVTDESLYQDEQLTNLTSSILFNMTDKKILYSKGAYTKVNPASITILTTALVILNHLELTKKITVPKEAVKDLSNVSTVELEAGDILSVEQLLYGMVLCSGIDAANTLAIACSGSVKDFMILVNKEIKQYGCVDSNYTNPGGLTNKNHYTTAYDIYLIMNKLLTNEKFMTLISTAKYDLTYQKAKGNMVSKTYQSTISYLSENRAVPKNLLVLGGKTGTTSAAGCCLTLFVKDSSDKIYSVMIMHAPTKESLYEQMDILIAKIVN